MVTCNLLLRVCRGVAFRCLSSASPSLTSVEREESPFYFGKTAHILGYTGLVRIIPPELQPEAFQERLAVVRDKLETCTLNHSHMLPLVYSCSSMEQIDTLLDVVSEYRSTVMPSIPPLPLALTCTLIHLERPELALEIFQKTSQYSLFPPCWPISLLMDAFLKREQYELALDAYDLLEQVFKPVTSLASAMGAFAHVCEGSAALMLEAQELLRKLHSSGWGHTAGALRIVFVVLRRQGREGEGRKLVQLFEGSGYFDNDDKLGEIVSTFIKS